MEAPLTSNTSSFFQSIKEVASFTANCLKLAKKVFLF